MQVRAGDSEPNIIVNPKQDLQAQVNATHEIKSNEDNKSFQQFEYEMGLQHAVVSYSLLKDFWPLKFPKKALKDNKVFDKNSSEILTTHTQTLLSINAPLYEIEIPELYALWEYAINLIDEAEAKSLYTPPENLRSLLTAWRTKIAIATEIDAAPWVHGPTSVSIDENLESITIPAGYRFLSAREHSALAERITEIQNAAITKEKINIPLFVDNKRISTNWLMPADNQLWSADIVVISHGHTSIDEPLPSNELLIHHIRSRLDPVSNLKMDDMGKYSENVVRWLIKPELDKQQATVRWANTDGIVIKPLGITFAHMKLGATQQVLICINHLQTAEYFATAEYLPQGKTHDDFKAENQLKRITTDLAPLFDSLKFVSGKRLEDSKEGDIQNLTPIEYLITGGPSLMEAGVKRIIAKQKRKENFWYFLQDHPRYQVTLLSLFVLFLLGVKSGVDNWMQQDGVWIKVFKKTLGLISIVVLIVGAFLIWINFHLK